MVTRIVLDPYGLAEFTRSEGVQKALADLGNNVADNVRGQGIKVGDDPGGRDEIDLPVEVHGPELGRSRPVPGIQGFAQTSEVVVSLAHAAGEAVQAKYGALTKAASETGLRLSGKK